MKIKTLIKHGRAGLVYQDLVWNFFSDKSVFYFGKFSDGFRVILEQKNRSDLIGAVFLFLFRCMAFRQVIEISSDTAYVTSREERFVFDYSVQKVPYYCCVGVVRFK